MIRTARNTNNTNLIHDEDIDYIINHDLTSELSSVNTQLENKVSKTGNETVSGNKTFTNNVLVNGNLTVDGTQTVVNVETMNLEDNKIRLNVNQTGIPPEHLLSGVEVVRGDEPSYNFVFEEETDLFKVGVEDELQAVATRDDTLPNHELPKWNATDTKLVASGVNANNLTGLTGNVQTQLNNKLNLSGGTITGNVIIESSNPVLTIRNNTGGYGGSLYFGNENHAILQRVDNNLEIRTAHASGGIGSIGAIQFFNGTVSNNSEKMRVDTNGNIGINTTTPQEKLHVNGNIRCNNLTKNTVLVSDSNKNIVSSSVSYTTLGFLDATSSIQTQLNNKSNTGHTHSISDITNLQTQLDSKANDSDVVKLSGSQSISGTKTFTSGKTNFNTGSNEVGYIRTSGEEGSNDKLRIVGPRGGGGIQFGVSSNLTDAMFLNAGGRLGIGTTTPQEKLHVGGNIRSDNLTTNTVLVGDTNKNIVSSTITNTELGYLSGATSNIQTQINNITGSTSGLTVNRALISNGSGAITTSTITDTELDYLSGVSSNVQTQINSKSNTGHTHSINNITGLQTELNEIVKFRNNSLGGVHKKERILYGSFNYEAGDSATHSITFYAPFLSTLAPVITATAFDTTTNNQRVVHVVDRSYTGATFRATAANGSGVDTMIMWMAIGRDKL